MAPRKRSAIAKSNIPPIIELCEKLGLRASREQEEDFLREAHNFRNVYQTSNGALGAKLLEWNKEAVRQELSVMSMIFLDKYGYQFWSPERAWRKDGHLCYPQDKTR